MMPPHARVAARTAPTHSTALKRRHRWTRPNATASGGERWLQEHLWRGWSASPLQSSDPFWCHLGHAKGEGEGEGKGSICLRDNDYRQAQRGKPTFPPMPCHSLGWTELNQRRNTLVCRVHRIDITLHRFRENGASAAEPQALTLCFCSN